MTFLRQIDWKQFLFFFQTTWSAEMFTHFDISAETIKFTEKNEQKKDLIKVSGEVFEHPDNRLQWSILKLELMIHRTTSLSLRNSEVHDNKSSTLLSWSSSHSSPAHRFWLGQVLPHHHTLLQEGGGGHHQLHAPRGIQPVLPSIQSIRHLQV